MTEKTTDSTSLAKRLGMTILVSSALSIFVLGPVLCVLALPLYFADKTDPPTWLAAYKYAWLAFCHIAAIALVIIVWKKRIGCGLPRKSTGSSAS